MTCTATVTAPAPSEGIPSTSSAAVAVRTIDSRIGPLTLAASAAGLRRLCFGRVDPASSSGGRVATDEACAMLQTACDGVLEYLAGTRRSFDIPLDPESQTAFAQTVLALVAAIPYGETSSYAQVAVDAGRPHAVRAVARVNARNPTALVVPCHRVIGSDGSLRGYGGGLPLKRWLLDLEAGAGGTAV